MLFAIASIWEFSVALRPSASAHRIATRQLTSAIVAGRLASVTTSLGQDRVHAEVLVHDVQPPTDASLVLHHHRLEAPEM